MINEKQAKLFCKEDISKIENYHKAIADTTQTWDLHHRTAIWWNCSRQELIDNECYYNRKACELIFLTHSEHNRLHNQGKQRSEDTRRKMSEAKKGNTHLKGHIHTEESRKKMSESHKNISDDTRKKISEKLKGKQHTADTKRKIAAALKGSTWKLIDGKRVYFPKEVK